MKKIMLFVIFMLIVQSCGDPEKKCIEYWMEEEGYSYEEAEEACDNIDYSEMGVLRR